MSQAQNGRMVSWQFRILLFAQSGIYLRLMTHELLRSLIWMDYRLAVLFIVLLPFGLLVWSFVQKAHSLSTLLIIYWRVASLLLITVYLLMAENALGFWTGLIALFLIPVSLWFWVDLNEEIEDRKGLLKICLSAWRWATSLYCVLAFGLQISYVNCAFSATAFSDDNCQAWLLPSIGFGSFFHSDLGDPKVSSRLGLVAVMGLVIYGLYFLNFLALRLSKKGRSATGA